MVTVKKASVRNEGPFNVIANQYVSGRWGDNNPKIEPDLQPCYQGDDRVTLTEEGPLLGFNMV